MYVSYTMIYDIKSEYFQRLLTGSCPPRVKAVVNQDKAANNVAKPVGPTGSA
jgi:hypothetical protein